MKPRCSAFLSADAEDKGFRHQGSFFEILQQLMLFSAAVQIPLKLRVAELFKFLCKTVIDDFNLIPVEEVLRGCPRRCVGFF